MGSANNFQAPSERILLQHIDRNDIAIHDLVALGYDLCQELEGMPVAAREASLLRLQRFASEYRSAGAAAEAALLDIVSRHLHRYFAPATHTLATASAALRS